MNQAILQKHTYKIYKGKDGRWRTYITVDGKRKMIVRKSRQDLDAILTDHYKVDTSATMLQLYPEWLKYKSLDVSEPTIRKYRDAWQRYYRDEEIIHTPVTNIKRIDIDAWANRQIDKYSLTRKGYNNMVVVINQILDYAVALEIIDHNPARTVRIRRGKLTPTRKQADETQVFSISELKQIKTQCYEDFQNNTYPKHSLIPLAVVFLFLTGLRVGEVSALKYEDIHDDIMTIQRMYRKEGDEILDHTKGSYGSRTVPLPSEALQIISLCSQKQAERHIKTQYVFSMTKHPAAYQGICRAFYKYSKQAGIRRSCHKARKTYISTLIDAGVNINTIRQAAGHVDEITTYHSYVYDRSDENAKKQAIKDAITTQDKPPKNIPNHP